MFLRARWFLFGVATTVGAGLYLLTRIRKMRRRLSKDNLKRVGAESIADLLDAAGRAVAPGTNGDSRPA